jgi:hypothetical protein
MTAVLLSMLTVAPCHVPHHTMTCLARISSNVIGGEGAVQTLVFDLKQTTYSSF